MISNQIERKKISELPESEETKLIIMEKLIKVHFIYHTAWVDAEGDIHFRNDLYYPDEITAEQL